MEYYEIYTKVDKDNDRTLNLSEFKKCGDVLEKWTGSIPNFETAFAEMDKSKTGKINFDEFCHWAIRRSFLSKEAIMEEQLKLEKERSKINHF